MCDNRVGSGAGSGWDPSIGTGDPGAVAGTGGLGEKLSAALKLVEHADGLGDAGDGGGAAAAMGLSKPTLFSGDLMVQLESLQSKNDEIMLDTSMAGVQTAKAKNEAAAKERAEKVKEQEDAANKAEKSGKWGKAFGWIAVGLQAIAGAVLIATGAGAAAGVALLASAAISAIQQSGAGDKILDGMAKGLELCGMDPKTARAVVTAVSGAVVLTAGIAAACSGNVAALGIAAQTMSGLFTPHNLEGMGVSPETAGWVSFGVSTGLAVASLATSAYGAYKAVGAAKDVGTTVAKASQKIPQMLGSVLGCTAEQVALTASKMSVAVTCLQAINMAAGGASGIATSVLGYEASQAEVDVRNTDKLMLKLKQMMQDRQQDIEAILKKMKDSVDIVMDVLSQEDMTNRRIVSV